jgi:hypothetical protein
LSSKPLKNENIRGTVKFNKDFVMVWGCITAEGVGELHRINGNVDSSKYIEILSFSLIKTMDKLGLDIKSTKFMQDNAPCHVSKMTREWLTVNKIDVIDWPAQSPDMNPIENLWAIIDRRIRRRVKQPTNSEELWEAIKKEWYECDKNTIHNLYMSLTRRIFDLHKAKGGYTKY